jgi:gamma-D-glutamyl-L-lysine dipeptidyl-peptidase
MSLLICVVPVCPIRAQSSHRSEQVSHLLFGEICEELERTTDFVKVRLVYDNYEGWCQQNQLEEAGSKTASTTSLLTSNWATEIMLDGKAMHVPFGSSIPASGFAGQHAVTFNGPTISVEENKMDEALLHKFSYTFLNTSYLWGGRSVFGVDCSGFTQLVYKCLNIRLLRDASQQATQGDEVAFLEEAKCGDLAFFDNEAGRITHVGILLNTSTIIHASGKVRIDTMEDSGIINSDTGKQTHKLRLIKRVAN